MTRLFSIKDIKIGFTTPWKHHNDASAIREFGMAVNLLQPNIANENIEDKELWLLGQFCETTGRIEPEVRFLCKALDLKKINNEKKENENDNKPQNGGNHGDTVRTQDETKPNSSTEELQ